MHLQMDQEIAVLTPQEAQSILTKLHEPISPNTPPDVLQVQIKTLQRSRHFCMWHDHDTIFGHGYIFITVRVLYDPAVFLTQEEKNQQYPSITNIQALIETPEIHMVGVTSSGHAEQAVLIPHRLPCIQELSDSFHTSSGVEIQDTHRFFKGDVLA